MRLPMPLVVPQGSSAPGPTQAYDQQRPYQYYPPQPQPPYQAQSYRDQQRQDTPGSSRIPSHYSPGYSSGSPGPSNEPRPSFPSTPPSNTNPFASAHSAFGRPTFGQPSLAAPLRTLVPVASASASSSLTSEQSPEAEKVSEGDPRRRPSGFILPKTRPGTEYVTTTEGGITKVRTDPNGGRVGWLERLGAGSGQPQGHGEERSPSGDEE
ncbi:hypothetical protein BV25DRAFT_1206965 [Artomyces pyxidatus]|uniref:Uncharacterized protein n=1 Tax=Artomyces pyxidatus TaxID=48021 RepID=A0ACB8SQF8_9AGAM|nr:hypothetical protein BV25DRAFT_1206965 [Artomyces pyxidatus]